MGFVCAESSTWRFGSVVFYCVMSMILFVVTLIMLILYLTKLDFVLQANWFKIELNFSAIGALVFMLISSLVVGHSSELLMVAAVSRLFCIGKPKKYQFILFISGFWIFSNAHFHYRSLFELQANYYYNHWC